MKQSILSDAEHDVGMTVQAKAIFELARLHIKKALKTELINTGFYKPYPTYYKDYMDWDTSKKDYGIPNNMKKLLFGTKTVSAFSSVFIQKTSYKKFCVAIAFYDPDNNTRINNWHGFFQQKGIGGYPTIVLYCPYNTPKIDSYGFLPASKIAEAFVSGLNVRTQELKSLFLHEFTHNYNYLQWLDKSKDKITAPRVKYNSPPSKFDTKEELDQYEAYVNDPQEINARYVEWIHAIQVSFTRLLRIKNADFDIRRAFPTFHDFWDFYWTTPGFVPDALRQWATSNTIKRLTKRLYGFYMFLVENEASDPAEVERFVQKQLELDYYKERVSPYENLTLARTKRTG